MVNKAALSVLGVIVLVSMGVGVLIGMQIGGGGAPAGASTPTGGDTDGTPGGGGSDSSVRTTIPAGGMETVQPPAGEETIPARRFEAREIERRIEKLVNRRRTNRGLQELITEGQIASELDKMAHSHSVAMADEGRVHHTIDGNSSRDRYEAAGLFSTCQFESDPGTYVVDAMYNRLEVIGYTVAGRTYEGVFLGNEKEVARAIVADWFSGESRHRLLYQNANQLGVGIVVTQSGDVYATGNVC
ncbi:MAG: CAP domain-containing protein [Halorientalis sp.]